MQGKRPPKRRDYSALGKFLRNARRKLRDDRTGRPVRVEDVAESLGVKSSFVYQVEQGKRKPRDGQLGNWASIYGVRYLDVWKCLGTMPMDFVASIKEEPEPVPVRPFARQVDLFSELTQEEKIALLPFLDFVRWKIAQQASRTDR